MKERLVEIANYLNNKDFSLALRRITDTTIDSENLDLFEVCLELHSTYEKIEQQGEESFHLACKELLNQLDQVSMPGMNNTDLLLEAQKLGKTYNTGGFGIRNIETTLKAGEITGLVGENGNGKTTLLRLIGGDLAPTAGGINYHFTDDSPGTYNFRSSIVFVPQRIPKWYGSLMDNLLFTNSFYGRKGRENELWAEMMVARLGLRSYKHLNWNRISSGYKTRFEIARVLLQKPSVLLLDEPLANLDIFAQQTLLNDLKYRAKSLTSPFGIMLSSQQLYEVEKISDKVIFLKNGQPQYQDFNESKSNEELVTIDESVFEIESNASHEEMEKALSQLPIRQIKFNGGAFIVSLDGDIATNRLFQVLGQSDLGISAMRNISNSTRRFFDA